MYWEEKIDLLARQVGPVSLNRHFADWAEILKRLEDRFINIDSPSRRFSNWPDALKSPIFIRTTNRKEICNEIGKLDPDRSYWAIFVRGDYPTAKHIVFECKPSVIEALLAITRGDFFIGDKKYNWLVHFKDTMDERVSLIKSSGSPTPFG
jgi:hypothetical protein